MSCVVLPCVRYLRLWTPDCLWSVFDEQTITKKHWISNEKRFWLTSCISACLESWEMLCMTFPLCCSMVESLCFLVLVEPPEESELHGEGGVRSGTRPVWRKRGRAEQERSELLNIHSENRKMGWKEKKYLKKDKILRRHKEVLIYMIGCERVERKITGRVVSDRRAENFNFMKINVREDHLNKIWA